MRVSRPGRIRSRVAVAAVAALALLGAAGCASDDSAARAAADGNADTNFVGGSGAVTIIKPGKREKLPRLAGPTLDGKHLDIADFRGKVVVLNVWGSWCAPCRKEAPDLVAAEKKLRTKGVQFVGVNSRDNDPQPARAFVRRFKVPYPSIYDPTGAQLLAFRDTLPPSAIPSTLVIDPQGRAAARVIGVVDETTLSGLVSDVVKE